MSDWMQETDVRHAIAEHEAARSLWLCLGPDSPARAIAYQRMKEADYRYIRARDEALSRHSDEPLSPKDLERLSWLIPSRNATRRQQHAA